MDKARRRRAGSANSRRSNADHCDEGRVLATGGLLRQSLVLVRCALLYVLFWAILYPRSLSGMQNQVGPPPNSDNSKEIVTDTRASDALVDEKLKYLDAAFDDMLPGGIAWITSWAVFFQGFFVYQLVDAVRGTENWMTSRTANIVGAVECQVSFVLTLALPFRPMTARRQFRRVSASNTTEKQHKLAHGEALLGDAKNDVDALYSWLSYLINFGMGIVGGAVVWGVEGRDGWKHALVSAGGSMVIAATYILSAPRKARRYYSEYTDKYGPNKDAACLKPSGVQLVVIPHPTILTIGLIF